MVNLISWLYSFCTLSWLKCVMICFMFLHFTTFAASKLNRSSLEGVFYVETLKEKKIFGYLDCHKIRNNDLFKQVQDKNKESGIERSI